MKKLLLCLPLVLMMVSCDSEEDPMTAYSTANSYNLISPVDGSTSYVTDCTYTFTYDFTNEKVSVAASELKFGSNSLTFTTPEASYSPVYAANETYVRFSMPSFATTDGGTSINNFKCGLYTYSDKSSDTDASTTEKSYLVMTYNIGSSYHVATFSKNSEYVGTTTNNYSISGVDGSFSTKDCKYDVTLDVSNNKASITLVNCELAPGMPVIKKMLLDNLDVTWENKAYSISGKNVVPSVYEAGDWTPNESFTFDKVSFTTTSDDLTTCHISYTIGGRYSGNVEFTGTILAL